MKTFYKTLMLGVFMAVLAVATPTFAQDVCADFDAMQALYNKYIENYKGTLEQKKTAVTSGNEFVQKYAACADYETQVNYLKKAVPKLEESIKVEEERIAKEKRYDRFNTALKTKNTSEIFASGDDILKYEPEFIDLSIALATVGFDEAVKSNDAYAGRTIDNAKSLLQKVEKGAKSEKWGIGGFEYNSKENLVGWLNYMIGYISYYRQNKKEAALPYLYKATQEGVETKTNPFIYSTIGDYYFDKVVDLGPEIVKIIEANDKQENYESKMKFAIQKGYADRAIDAYARAYKIAQADKNSKPEYVSGLKDTLTKVYKFRFETKDNPLPENIDAALNTHVASVTSKPLPNPTSEVQPVDPPSEEEKSTENTTTSNAETTTPGKTATNGTTTTNGNKPKQQ